MSISPEKEQKTQIKIQTDVLTKQGEFYYAYYLQHNVTSGCKNSEQGSETSDDV